MSTPLRSNSLNNERAIQVPADPQRAIGLATVTYTRIGHEEEQRYHFQDDHVIPAKRVANMNGHQEAQSEEATDIDSECSLSDRESQEEAKQACHCFRDTEIDESSNAINGDMVDGMRPSSTRKHHMRGGSVKGKSRLVNGDLDRHAFLAFFCRD
ncbi:hypothetical protein BDV33DRAFT_185682 [Aspergillus novoparasiticus]|uniref:Uncharacterized protein n=1 Tax=Aspergillus novoparasiticus TaxID=986946 RepID=A0A5N6E6K2_9EURO|nr:hypothetical protein BDV33DRAFT_185682 [Aspergillus novoparasiticus]